MVSFLLLSAVVPSMLLIWFFHSRDVYPEPQRVVWATFGLGVLTVLPVVVIELLIMKGLSHVANPFLSGTLEGFFCAGFTEELFKYLVVVLYCMRHKEFDEPMDGIVYGAVASLGFATLENVLYVSSGGAGPAIMRALSAVPGHACMGAVMGYYVGQAKFRPRERTSLMVKGLLVPMLLHGAYDAPLLSAARLSAGGKAIPKESAGLLGLYILVTLATLIGEVVWTLVLSSRLRKEQQTWHAARWAAYYANQPPPPPPWFAAVASPPTWAYAPAQQVYPAPRPQSPQGYPQSPQGPMGYPQRPHPAQQEPASSGGAVLSWLLVLSGAVLATGGGLMALGAVLALVAPRTSAGAESSPAAFMAVGVLFGALPLLVGAALFFLGMKRLVAVAPPPPPRAYPVY